MSSDHLIVTLPGKKVVQAEYQGFTFLTDQPVDNGGDNTAPTPFALFLASIGTCAGIFVSSFCQNRGIPIEGIRLVQRMKHNATTHVVEGIEIDIEVPQDFPAEYHDALVRVANQCAVKKTIAAQPEFIVKTVVR